MPPPAFSRNGVWVADWKASGERERRWAERLVIGEDGDMIVWGIGGETRLVLIRMKRMIRM